MFRLSPGGRAEFEITFDLSMTASNGEVLMTQVVVDQTLEGHGILHVDILFQRFFLVFRNCFCTRI